MKCIKCKTQYEKGAEKCPNCGDNLKAQRTKGCLFGVIFLAVAIVVAFAFFGGDDDVELTSAEIRQNEIGKCFSAWDGSHLKLTEAIKESLNDENSYEHVNTSYIDQDSLLIVETTFSAKNAFGGVLKKSVIATTNNNCEVVEIIQWYQ